MEIGFFVLNQIKYRFLRFFVLSYLMASPIHAKTQAAAQVLRCALIRSLVRLASAAYSFNNLLALSNDVCAVVNCSADVVS